MTPGSTPRDAVIHADSTMDFVGAGRGDTEHRTLLHAVAEGVLTGTEAADFVAQRHGLRIDRRMTFPVETFEDYLIPGTTVLRSRIVDADHPLGIDDPDLLRAIELQLSHLRVAELARNPIPGHFGYEHMKAFHRAMFVDIYPWAGLERVGPETAMVRFARDAADHGPLDPAAPTVKYSYYPGPEIAEAASVQFSQLELWLERRGQPRAEFLQRISEMAAEVMTIHAFRDGNLRAQWVYSIYYNAAVGVPMDLDSFARDTELNDRILHSIRRYQLTGDHQSVFNLVDQVYVSSRDVGRG